VLNVIIGCWRPFPVVRIFYLMASSWNTRWFCWRRDAITPTDRYTAPHTVHTSHIKAITGLHARCLAGPLLVGFCNTVYAYCFRFPSKQTSNKHSVMPTERSTKKAAKVVESLGSLCCASTEQILKQLETGHMTGADVFTGRQDSRILCLLPAV